MNDYAWLPADLRAFVARTEAHDPPEGVAASIDRQREAYDRMCLDFDGPIPETLELDDVRIAGVPCRWYRPRRREPAERRPVALYLHGGGFVLGGLHSHDSICADLAARSEVELVAVDYRLAPEHPHPAAFDDAVAVVQALNMDCVLVGDSAGGNLAAALSARPDLTQIRGQILIYPGLGGDPDQPSMRHHAEAPLLRAADVAAYHRMRAGPEGAPVDITAAPLAAEDFSSLPPTEIFAAECDPLASDAVGYAQRLAAASVAVRLTIEPFLMHGYLRARGCSVHGDAAFDRIARALAQLVNHEVEAGRSVVSAEGKQ